MKRAAFVAAVLVGAGILAGASQPMLKNKKPRIVSIKQEKELTLRERLGVQTALLQSIRSFRVDNQGNIHVLDISVRTYDTDTEVRR